ncbi:MAG: BlaI/MecI/CopY family transcriptional regulator [Candidatus Latescibacteria bacterium]|nr:BlaI/MecI/CopY family transcriptional regulator [Candidatus Latescibacterota bacterium]
MSDKNLPHPTDAELAILRILWQRGPSTVGEVQAGLSKERGTGYTTALKLLQIMTDKGLVERDTSRRAHVYRTRSSQDQTEQQLVDDLLEKAFGGSAARLVMQALSTRRASAEELEQIRRLLDKQKGDMP